MEELKNDEKLARYIYSKSHYRISDYRVKYSAFIPPQDGCLSVFHISELVETEIWSIGKNLRKEKKLLGRADIKVRFVFDAKLLVDTDNIPLHHANITGWPSDGTAIKLKAIELAEKANLYLK